MLDIIILRIENIMVNKRYDFRFLRVYSLLG